LIFWISLTTLWQDVEIVSNQGSSTRGQARLEGHVLHRSERLAGRDDGRGEGERPCRVTDRLRRPVAPFAPDTDRPPCPPLSLSTRSFVSVLSRRRFSVPRSLVASGSPDQSSCNGARPRLAAVARHRPRLAADRLGLGARLLADRRHSRRRQLGQRCSSIVAGRLPRRKRLLTSFLCASPDRSGCTRRMRRGRASRRPSTGTRVRCSTCAGRRCVRPLVRSARPSRATSSCSRLMLSKLTRELDLRRVPGRSQGLQLRCRQGRPHVRPLDRPVLCVMPPPSSILLIHAARASRQLPGSCRLKYQPTDLAPLPSLYGLPCPSCSSGRSPRRAHPVVPLHPAGRRCWHSCDGRLGQVHKGESCSRSWPRLD
jgi:hypothetical protein